MGIPLYGRGFVLNNTEETGLYCGAHAGIPKVKLNCYFMEKMLQVQWNKHALSSFEGHIETTFNFM